MDFNKFKKVFDESFGKVTPNEFIQRMENLGYKFISSESKNEIKSDEQQLQQADVINTLCRCNVSREIQQINNRPICVKCNKPIF